MTQRQVLYVHPSDELYGADRSLLRLARGLDPARYRPHVAVAGDLPYQGLLTQALAQAGVPTRKLALGVMRRRYRSPWGMLQFGWNTVTSALQLARYCRQHQIALIHSNSIAVTTGGLAARLARLPHVWHVREIITEPAWLRRVTATWLLRFADRVVVVSGPVGENLVTCLPALAPKLATIHNGIDTVRFLAPDPAQVAATRRAWQADDQTVVVGMIGRVSHWKGQSFLLQAMRQVSEGESPVRLALVGGVVPGEAWRVDALKRQAQELGLEGQVHIEDFRQDTPVVLAAMDVFVLPSTLPDPFPTVVLEAMAAGKPVVATAHGGALEQVADGVTGFLVSPHDDGEMVAALARLVQNRALRLEMGAAGRERVTQLFTTGRYVQHIEELYDTLLGSGDAI